MKVMGGLDRMFLGLESEALLMDNVGIFTLDPSTAPDRLDFERVRAELALRAPHIPAFIQRPVEVPFGVGPPCWLVDPDFSIDDHVHRVAAPSPGGLRELSQLAIDLFRRPMKRDRPLWDLWYVEGMADGGAAALLRIHHAAMDGMGGMGGMEAMDRLLDDAPLPFDAARRPEPLSAERVPGSAEMWLRSLPGAVRNPLEITRSALSLIGSRLPSLWPGGGRPDAVEPRTAELASGGDDTRPRSLFNTYPRHTLRSHALASVPLADVFRVKNALGVTVNDVTLAMVAGTIRDYLLERGELPEQPLRTVCPVNVRGDESHHSDDANQFVFMLVDLPTQLPDPVERLKVITAATSTRRRARSAPAPERSGPSPTRAVLDLIDALPITSWSLLGMIAPTPALTAIPPIFNLAMSNVRGPDHPLYLAGARITHLYGRTMVGAGVGLFIHCVSYGEDLDFGVTSFRDLVPDPEVLADGLRRELGVLVERAGA